MIHVSRGGFEVWRKVGFDFHRGPQGAAQQPGDPLHQCRDLDGFGLEFLTPGKGQHALGQRNTAHGALGGVVQQTNEFRIVPDTFTDDFQVSEDYRQQVVKVVGDPAAELADGLHLLRLEQRFAGLLKGLLGLRHFGDITGDLGETEQRAGLTPDWINHDVSQELRTVLAHTPGLVFEFAFTRRSFQRPLRLTGFTVLRV